MSRNGGNRRQFRGRGRLKPGSVDNLQTATSQLAAEFGVSDVIPYVEEPQQEDFGIAELLTAGTLIVMSGIINLQF